MLTEAATSTEAATLTKNGAGPSFRPRVRASWPHSFSRVDEVQCLAF